MLKRLFLSFCSFFNKYRMVEYNCFLFFFKSNKQPNLYTIKCECEIWIWAHLQKQCWASSHLKRTSSKFSSCRWNWTGSRSQFIFYWDDSGDKRPVMCLVLTRWSRIMSACRSAHFNTESWLWASRVVLSTTCWRVIFMMFKCSLINCGIKPTLSDFMCWSGPDN